MFEPVRGGTRGGQAEFKWSDVSADKDRENYLGHSINAPTGRWQKNKDVHWYNRDKAQNEINRLSEIQRVKELEAEALATALGFTPTTSGGDAIPPSANSHAGQERNELPPALDQITQENSKRQRKAEKKAERRLRRELRQSERLSHRRNRRSRSCSRSRSPHRPNKYAREQREYTDDREQSRSGHRREEQKERHSLKHLPHPAISHPNALEPRARSASCDA